MTVREMFEYALIELNKVEAPSLLLEDYNYFINKAIYQYINKNYNAYDLNQQKTDDLRVLKETALLDVGVEEISPLWGDKVYIVDLPNNYFHLLSCIVNYVPLKQFKCYSTTDNVQFGARRLTADMYGQIINNYYMRPMYKRPYYFINNRSFSESFSYSSQHNAINSPVKLELRYGKRNDIFVAKQVLIDYLKTPNRVSLTNEQIELDEDTSQVMEFPDYACHEIINELVKLLMENSSDPRLQTNIPINQTIAPPQQVQPQESRR